MAMLHDQVSLSDDSKLKMIMKKIIPEKKTKKKTTQKMPHFQLFLQKKISKKSIFLAYGVKNRKKGMLRDQTTL